MILLQTILSRIRQIGLDAEGADYYRDDIDLIPAVNAAIEWVVSVLSGELGKNKFVEERLSDLHTIKVWQTSYYSRVALSEVPVWTITGVYPKPKIVISPYTPDVENAYFAQMIGQFNKILENKPISKVNTLGLTLANFESMLRPEMTFVEATHEATRVTTEQRMAVKNNPFVPGYPHDHTLFNYAYFPNTNYSSYGYAVTTEIELSPALKRELVAVSYLKVPSTISSSADPSVTYVEFPDSMTEIICLKALNNIAFKQGDGTSIYKVSVQDLITLLQ